MQVITVGANKSRHLRFDPPRSRRVHYRVVAKIPVSTYVVYNEGREDYVAQREIRSIGGFINRCNHWESLPLDRLADWWLIIYNPHECEVDVFYEVYYW